VTSDQALDELIQTYQHGPICVFTGAGVSFTEARLYQAPGWWDLLLETYLAIHPALSADEARTRFEALRADHPLAWDTASTLVADAGGEAAFLEIMRRVLVGRTGRDTRYKRLPRAYLGHAATLNAVIALCSRLRAIRVHPCFEPNPNVRAVLTLNYDWFLEGGATQKYNANPFKPMSSLDSREEPGRLPVYHIHGYVPHDLREEPEHPLILTAESYRHAYGPGTFTSQMLDCFLGRFPTLFVGISFEDELLVKRLESLAQHAAPSAHFALLKQGSVAEALLDRLRDAGMTPILYADHGLVPAILGRVYQGGLGPDDLVVPLESKGGKRLGERRLSPEDYWALLLVNKL
jgi:hypothetical protein